MEETTIPPKSEWQELSPQQLLDVKLQISDKYYAMRSINASFANQYLRYISEIETLINIKENEKQDDD